MAVTRVTGTYSGFDTDKLVKDLMKIEQTKVDNIKRDKQRLQWKQDDYRDMTTLVNEFKSTYFDVLNPKTNITSKTMFSEFSTSVTSNGVDSDVVEVTGTSQVTDLTHTIDSITQLATKDEYSSSELGFTKITSDVFDIASIPDEFKMNISLDGQTKTISFNKVDMDSQDIDGFIDSLQDKIEENYGVEFRDVVSKDVDKIVFEKSGTAVTIINYPDSEDSLTALGISSGTSNVSYKNKSIGDLLGIVESDLVDMKIGSKSFVDLGITEESTIKEAMDAINAGHLDAEISYNSLSDKFEMFSTKEGVLNSLDLSDKFKEKFKLDSGTHTTAKNAIVRIDGSDVTKSTNTFTLSGIQYSLKKVHTADPIDIAITRDTEKVQEKIKTFVDAYNTIVSAISSKINEKTYRTYKPLTDEEKKDLTDEDVKLWEKKAKSGSLKNDSILTTLLSGMRAALYETVEGAGATLYNIGITTTNDYKDNGKLVINETKLKESLETDFDSVVNLFTSKSDKDYLDSDNSSERYKESGLGARLLDIMNNAVRLTGNNSGFKGSLIEKAGLPGDTSTTSNSIAKELTKYDTRIDKMLDYLANQETRYYNQFGAMEKALSQLQSQSSSLVSMLG